MNYKPEKAISLEDFYMLCVIGKGSYAKVVLVKRKDTGEIMALKILKKEMIEKRKQEEHVRTEREVLVSRSRIKYLVTISRSKSPIPSLLSSTALSKMRRSYTLLLNTAPAVNFSTCSKRENTLLKTSTSFFPIFSLN